jgi:hypothetical protein
VSSTYLCRVDPQRKIVEKNMDPMSQFYATMYSLTEPKIIHGHTKFEYTETGFESKAL